MTAHLTSLFRLALEASWQGSLIILLILAVRSVMSSKIPARWRGWLWGLVLIRLLIPTVILPPNPVSIQNFAVVDRPIEQVALAVVPPSKQGAVPAFIQRQGPELPTTSEVAIAVPASKSFSMQWFLLAALIWGLGVLTVLAFLMMAHRSLWLRLKKSSSSIDPDILRIWKECCERLGVKNRPPLRMSVEVTSPALVGLRNPTLILPESNLTSFSAQDWENVFVHELAHYRRADHWLNLVQLAALAVHWFNPLVWIGFRQLRADRELAADEWALQNLKPESSTAYGQTLLKVLMNSSEPKFSVTSVGILEDSSQLKQRMRWIMAFGPRKLIGSALGLGIVVVVAALVIGRHTEKADLTQYEQMTPAEIFVVAAKNGDLPTMKAMLRRGVDVNVVPETGSKQTALIAAAGANQMEAIKLLLSKGANINLKTDKSAAPAQKAFENGWSDCGEYLIAHGATCDAAIVAAAKGDQATLQPLLAQEAGDSKQLEQLCRVAAANGQADLFVALQSRIRSLPGKTYWDLGDGTTLTAIARGHRNVVQAILDTSRTSQTLNKFGVMRLTGAASQSPGMREWLIAKGFTVPEYTDGEKLIDATEREDLPEMERLLRSGVDVNYRGESSWTPITKAAAWNKVRSTKLLLAHGADPNSVHLPKWDYTAICLTSKPEIADMVLAAGGNINATLYQRGVHIMDYAVTFGHTEMVKWYIAHGVDPKKVQGDNTNRTFLFEAGSPEVAELLIQSGIDVNQKDKSGETALFNISTFKEKPAEIVRVLLKHGADPNIRNKYGQTPLMVAKDGATVDVLAEYGADFKAKTKDGSSIIEVAGNVEDSSRIEALLKHGVPFDPKTQGAEILIRAAHMGHADVIAQLLKMGVDPNRRGYWNKQYNVMTTPLSTAVTFGNFDCAKLLLEYGAKIHETGKDGKDGMDEMQNALYNRQSKIVQLFWEHGDRSISELDYAISQRQPSSEIKKLLDRGISPNSPKNMDLSPLALASQLGDLETVKLLVEHGADIVRSTALDHAASEGQHEIVQYLLEKGAKPNYAILHQAVWNSNPYDDQRGKEHFEKTIRILIDAGALKDIPPKEGAQMLRTAIFPRQPSGNITVIKMLLDGGLNLNLHLDDGKTVMDVARAACKQESCSTPSKELMAFLEQANKKPLSQ